jgi:hypothetical protein
MVIPPAPLVSVPEFEKLPDVVMRFAPGVSVAPELMVSGTAALNILAAFKLMAPVLAMVTPPVAVNGDTHSSSVTVLAVVVLYCNDALEPYVTTPVVTTTVAVPCKLRIPLTVGVVANVLTPEPDKVRLLKVNTGQVCAVPEKLTVPVFGVNVPPEPESTEALEKLMVLEPPSSVPLLLVHVPVKTCESPVPRFNVPPTPSMVKFAPFTLPVNVATPPVLFITKFPVVVNPAMLWAAVPFKLSVDELAFKVPAVMVKLPVKEWVNDEPKFNVPPEPFNIMLDAETSPVKVAVAPVLVMVIFPVVVKPAILWLVIPVIIIGELPSVAVPFITKLPCMVS